MNKATKIIGWVVLAFTELLIAAAALRTLDFASLVGYQVMVFGVVWGAVGVKNMVDMRRDVNRFKSSKQDQNSGEYQGG